MPSWVASHEKSHQVRSTRSSDHIDNLLYTQKSWKSPARYLVFCYFDNRKAQSKIIYLQKAIEQSESKEQNVQDQLASVIKVVSIITI